LRRRLILWAMTVAFLAPAYGPGMAWAVERYPPPDFESDYRPPAVEQKPPRAGWMETVDMAVLLAALGLAAFLALKKRSRKGIALLTVGSLLYFGFYRGGCVCPIGAIQNVARGLVDPNYVLPISVIVFFALPVVFALFFGRVFCSGVCPLGAMQDVVLLKPVRVPRWLHHGLSVIPYIYLGAAILFAATGTAFIICRWDPFVSFFRLSGEFRLLIFGGGVLLIATVIGRPYCRFLCPYGALLNICSRFSRRHASITPDECVVCGLCAHACPFDAIRPADTEKGQES